MGKSGYAQKRKHKRIMQKKYTTQYWNGRYSAQELRDKLEREAEEDAGSYWSRKHPPRNNGWEYWRLYYLTGKRQYAKKYSDKRIRQKYRQMISHGDPEDVSVPRRADYQKEYDYNWTIW